MDFASLLASLGSFILSFFGITDAPEAVQMVTGLAGALILVGVGLRILRWGMSK